MRTLRTQVQNTAPIDKKSIKIIRLVLKILILVALLAVLLLSMSMFRRKFFSDNPLLALEKIEVSETSNYSGEKVPGKISVNTLLSELGIEIGVVNLLNVDLAAVRNRLEHECLLKNVEIRRLLPNTLKINFQERKPRARIFCGANSCYIDGEAFILPINYTDGSRLNYSVVGLPTITAITNPDKLIHGQRTNDKLILTALKLIDLTDQRPDKQYFLMKQIQLVETQDMIIAHISPLEGSAIFTADAEIKFPVNGLEEAVDRLFILAGKYKGTPIRSIDVTYENNTPIQF